MVIQEPDGLRACTWGSEALMKHGRIFCDLSVPHSECGCRQTARSTPSWRKVSLGVPGHTEPRSHPRLLIEGIRLGAPMDFRCWRCADIADQNCMATGASKALVVASVRLWPEWPGKATSEAHPGIGFHQTQTLGWPAEDSPQPPSEVVKVDL